MIDVRTVHEIQDAPVEERIRLIEQILQSIRQDIQTPLPTQESKFRIRTFSLGREIQLDREQIYAERIG